MELRFDYPTCEYSLAAAQLVLATLGMGVTLRPRDFVYVLRSPRALALVFFVQLILAPVLALSLGAALGLPPGLVLGMVLMAAMPTGALAGIFVYLGRGQVALALATTGLTTIASLFSTPLVLHVFGSGEVFSSFEMPAGRMLTELTLCLFLPLAVAMTLARVAPRGSRSLGKWCVRGSFVTLASLLVGSLASGRLQVAAYGWQGPVAVAGFVAAVFLFTYPLGVVLRLTPAESFTVSVLTALRNGNLPLLLKARLFPATALADPIGDAVLFVVLFYSGASLVISAAGALVRRATTSKAAAPEEPSGQVQTGVPLATSPSISRGEPPELAAAREAPADGGA